MTKKITLMCNGKRIEITPLTSGVIGDEASLSSEIIVPGQGSFEISIPSLSQNEIYAGEPVSCRATVKGKKIAQISSEIMIQVSHFMVGPVHSNFIQSSEHREVKGIVHPHWDFENEIEFEIVPEGRLLYCGEGFTMACMTPERYDVDQNAQIWSLEGVYQRGGGEPFRVQLDFDNQGALVRKTGFFPASVKGLTSPFELLIEDGDTFEPYVTLISDKGKVSTGTASPIMLGGGNQLHWQTVDACQGVYHIGVAVKDFDGQMTRTYSPLTINQPK